VRVLTGQVKGAKLRTARTSGVRPTSGLVKGAIFNTLPAEAVEGARVLDLYAGTGALGIEALSRGAAHADFVERSGRMCRLISDNLEAAGLRDRSRVFAAPVERALGMLQGPYNLVLMDPPYAEPGVSGILVRLAESGLLAGGATVVLEHAHRNPPPPAAGCLVLLKTRRYGDTAVTYYRMETPA
jgi:16S rRNA (guanine966-N2)-methyltransferase